MLKQTQIGSKKVRTGDTVIVIAGNSKGQVGTVLSCRGDRVLIQGVNIRKKAVRRSEQNPKGGLIEVERPIHISNVSPCDGSGARVKLRVRIDESGEKKLCYQKNGTDIEYRSMKRSENQSKKSGG